MFKYFIVFRKEHEEFQKLQGYTSYAAEKKKCVCWNETSLTKMSKSLGDTKSLSQSATPTTWDDTVLGLPFHDSPKAIKSCKVIPGLSDHSIVVTVTDITATKIKACKPFKVSFHERSRNDNISDKPRKQLSASECLVRERVPILCGTYWKTKFLRHCEKHIYPGKCKKRDKPWVTNHLSEVIKQLCLQKYKEHN